MSADCAALIRSVSRPALGSLVAVTLALTGLAVAQTKPSQKPLLTKVGDVPSPNVFVTLDDSGSMDSDFMPEGTIKMGSYSSFNIQAGGTGFLEGTNTDTKVVLAVKNASVSSDNVYQAKFRSPEVNTMFYNPDVYYRPWATSTSTRKTASPPTAAPLTYNSTTKFDLTTTKTGVTRKWCTSSSSCTSSSKDFYPGLYYRLTPGADPNLIASYTRYDINSTGSDYAPATKHPDREDCAGTKCTQAEERQNFANWFTYYRDRLHMAKGAISETLTNFVGRMRVGIGAINASGVVLKHLRDLSSTHLSAVLTSLQGRSAGSGTPLRVATDSVGKYFLNRGNVVNNPWLTDPAVADGRMLSCRRSYHLLTTDGYYNDGSPPSVGNVDGTDGTDYAGSTNNPNNNSPTKYTAQRPFSDTYSDTLADVAMLYYKQDLDTSIPNKVIPTNTDIAYWQHLTQFMVPIGLRGTLDSTSTSSKASVVAAIKAGTLSWPDPSGSGGAKIDDMWHAAVNTGGDFYSAANVTQLVASLNSAFNTAVGTVAREAGVSVSAATLTAGSYKFVPKYRSISWWGDLEAYALDAYGDVAANAPPTWTAESALPAAADRNLYTWNGTSAVAFTWATIGSTNQTSVGSENLLNYIRGDSTNEGRTKTYRDRVGHKLGDFVNSTPAVVKDVVDLSYGLLSDTAQSGSYAAYLTAKKARSDGVVFIGGNAGIMSGFRISDGREVFGYLPRAGLASLASIADQDYGGIASKFHTYFVDGRMYETDAYITPRGESSDRWTNMVLGSMGAGGKTVFAVHVPTAMTPSSLVTAGTMLGANSVQWELSGDADLGYVTAEIRVGKIQGAGGDWYAFIGNGSYSTNGKAVLLVVNLQTGAIVKRLQVDTTGANGLMGVRLARNINQEVYAAYAGDLQGNLWRFDFPSASSADWTVGFAGKPLYRAKNGETTPAAQPITAAPTLSLHPSGGVMVLFGTGKLLDDADPADATVQSFYGVWDPTTVGASAASTPSPFAAYETAGTDYRTALQEQTVGTTAIAGTGGSAGLTYYTVSTNPVDWNTQKGWFIDLKIASRQRVLTTAQTVTDLVYITTMVPVGDVATCEVASSTAYGIAVKALTGAANSFTMMDVNGDGVVNNSDRVDTNGDGVVNGSDGGVAVQQNNVTGVSQLLGMKRGTVHGEDDPLTNKLPVCKSAGGGAESGKCPENYCLVAVVNINNDSTQVCVPDLCAYDPTAKICNAKVIADRVWRRIMSPPQP